MNCHFCNEILSYAIPVSRSRNRQYILILETCMEMLHLTTDPRILGIVMYKITHYNLNVLATLEHLNSHGQTISVPIRSDVIKSPHSSYFENLTILIHLAVFYFYDYCTILPRESVPFLDEYSNGECTQLPNFRLLDRCSFDFKTTNKWYHSH